MESGRRVRSLFVTLRCEHSTAASDGGNG